MPLTVYICTYLHPPKKKCCHPQTLFVRLSISLSFLEFEWKILYHWKANILNFFMVQKIFLYFEDFLSYEFLNKSRVFLPYQKYHFFSSNQKKFFLWNFLVALIILQKKFCQKLPSLIRFWHSELHTEFQQLKILHFFFKILTK